MADRHSKSGLVLPYSRCGAGTEAVIGSLVDSAKESATSPSVSETPNLFVPILDVAKDEDFGHDSVRTAIFGPSLQAFQGNPDESSGLDSRVKFYACTPWPVPVRIREGVYKSRNPASLARVRMRPAVWTSRSDLDVHSFTNALS